VILLVALLLGVAVAWSLGARLSLLADIRPRGDALVFGALAVQLVIFTPLAERVPAALATPLHVASYLMILAFLALNVRLSGLWLVTAGVLANVLVIFSNGGRMPVSLASWEATGAPAELIRRTGEYNNNVLAGPDTRFAWLGDVFALPPGVPLANSLSIGDILIIAGMVLFVLRACAPAGRRSAAGRKPAVAAAAAAAGLAAAGLIAPAALVVGLVGGALLVRSAGRPAPARRAAPMGLLAGAGVISVLAQAEVAVTVYLLLSLLGASLAVAGAGVASAVSAARSRRREPGGEFVPLRPRPAAVGPTDPLRRAA
jgi:hypothetical protein